MKPNYQTYLDDIIRKNQKEGVIPSLLLHSCCAPCSSYTLEYLSNYFHITIFYYNPNITDKEEYQKRVEEQKRLIEALPVKYPVSFIEGDYEPSLYEQEIEGLEQEKEGGKRCFVCYEMRLRKTIEVAHQLGMDYFGTTLSISPYKNASKLNEIGESLSRKYPVKWLYADFKKKNGYKRSIELSRQYDLYRQDYCGCIYSMQREVKE